MDFVTKDEKEILDTYLTDTLGELERGLDCAERVEIEALCNIIETRICLVKDIKETLGSVEIQEDIV